MNKKWFTLVELIVVITIVSILSTIWFVVYTDYLVWVRDSNRLQQISSLHSGLELYATKAKIPLSKNIIQIKYGTSNVAYQWDIDQSVLDAIKYTDGWFDPKTKDFYTYVVSDNRKYTQIMAFFEEANTDFAMYNATTYAATNYESLFPVVYGSELGVLLGPNNVPIQKDSTIAESWELNLSSLWYNLIAILSNTNTLEGVGDELIWLVPNTNCKSINSLIGAAESWFYKINPSWIQPISVYCEMDDNNKWYWEGWLLVARTQEDAAWETNFWWLYATWDVRNDDAAYSLWSGIKDVRFSEFMFATYDAWKNITAATIVWINDIFFGSEISSPELELDLQRSTSTSCNMVYNSEWFDESCYSNYDYWWAFGYKWAYIFNRQDFIEAWFIYPDRFDSSNNWLPKDKDTGGTDPNYDNFRGNQWMLFVR